ncbi:hypothetical protein H1R20_g8453, partial [Candolleomyces eurysporus]
MDNPVTDTLEDLRREREMNRLSTRMNQFHTYFKSQYPLVNTLYEACPTASLHDLRRHVLLPS